MTCRRFDSMIRVIDTTQQLNAIDTVVWDAHAPMHIHVNMFLLSLITFYTFEYSLQAFR